MPWILKLLDFVQQILKCVLLKNRSMMFQGASFVLVPQEPAVAGI